MSCRRCSVNVLFLHISLLFPPLSFCNSSHIPSTDHSWCSSLSLSLSLSLSFFFFVHTSACGILVPRAGMEPVPHAAEAWSFNHWIAREVPLPFLFFHKAQAEPVCGINLVAPCPGAELRSWPWAIAVQSPPWRTCMVVPPCAAPKGHFASWDATYASPAPSLNYIFIVPEPSTW